MKRTLTAKLIKQIKDLNLSDDDLIKTCKLIELNLFNEENLKSLIGLKENFQEVLRLSKALITIHPHTKKTTFLKNDCAKLIECSIRELKTIIYNDFYTEEDIAYGLNKILENEPNCKKATQRQGIAYYKNKICNRYLSTKKMKVYDDVLYYELITLLITNKKNNSKYIVIPKQTKLKNYQYVIDGCVIFSSKDTLDENELHFSKIIKKYSIFKGKYLIYNNKILEITSIDSQIKFNIDQVLISKEISKETDIILDMFQQYNIFNQEKVPFKRTILFQGIPGVGKTTIINSLIKQILINNKENLKNRITILKFMGESNEIATFYKMANKFKPALIIIEDWDLISQSRNNSERQAGEIVSTSLLDYMEESTSYNGLISLFTTNQQKSIDAAAKRPGRISACYVIDYPSMEEKKLLIRLHLEYYKLNITYDELYKKIKKIIESDITGAVIANLMLSIKQHSLSKGRIDIITDDDVKFAINNIIIKRRSEDSIL
jgi:AAA+ superfamily predicted ATPase